ncbi:hypothetical protein ACV3Q3_12295 [Clostridium perfringens]|uniref:hypothetical protein n=1 Tax=Clostridium perfringens TaxID=1502 RepID=UPI00070761D2|nr:hypothetical protein [Clostridium perfringens]KQC91381.1 hypothetical protein AM596_15245 [Clostridium perfringens CP4]NGS95830.1 hypothetical protein [Clostridium perfringens]
MIQNIIIGKPLVSLELLGIEPQEETVFDTERFLPRLLVKYGFSKSISEIKRNRKDLVRYLEKPDMEMIKLGKKKVWIIVGE